jgi:hypothetical protein
VVLGMDPIEWSERWATGVKRHWRLHRPVCGFLKWTTPVDHHQNGAIDYNERLVSTTNIVLSPVLLTHLQTGR